MKYDHYYQLEFIEIIKTYNIYIDVIRIPSLRKIKKQTSNSETKSQIMALNVSGYFMEHILLCARHLILLFITELKP